MTQLDSELRYVLSTIDRLCENTKTTVRILDVGCGYGRLLHPLTASGYAVIGIETNAAIVEKNRQAGLSCVRADALERAQNFDLIIMSHIIEHFQPASLLDFLESYLDLLKPGGSLVIATPLFSSHFYDDFDHVKPYHPMGISMVFGGGGSQVQYYSRNRLKLTAIWYRSSPIQIHFFRYKHFRSLGSKTIRILELGLIVLHTLSFGWIGKKDGWVGVFRKE